jgi:hypothetical protein
VEMVNLSFLYPWFRVPSVSRSQKPSWNFSHTGPASARTIDHGRYQERAQILSGLELAGFSEAQLPLVVASDNGPSIASLLKSVVTNAIHGAKILEAGGSRHDTQEAAEVIDVPLKG